LTFEWDRKHELSGVKVYWFNDTGRGACKIPESWTVSYMNAAGEYELVDNKTSYGIEKNMFNRLGFTPVKTNAIKIEIKLQKQWSAGVQEVIIE
jgi:hypothetical protein